MKTKIFTIGIVICITATSIGFSQGVTFGGKAKVLENHAETKMIVVDLWDDDNEFIRNIEIDSETSIIDKKGNKVEFADLVPGTEIELVGEKINYKDKVKEIKTLVKWIGDEVTLDGIIEFYNPATEVAVIDGQKVRLAEGTIIKGTSQIKGKFSRFSELSLGNYVSCKGTRMADGIVYASSASVKENVFDKIDHELVSALSNEFSSKLITEVAVPDDLKKYTENLSQGQVQFGDMKLTLCKNLKVQAYVNYVGNSVIPEWQKNIPDEAPEKLQFRFYVVENPIYNAFALPNGMIFVNTGLLSVLDNEAQLAAVLGHEVAHVTHEHAKERYRNQQNMEQVMSFTSTAIRLVNKTSIKDDELNLALLLASDMLSGDILSKNFVEMIPYLKTEFVPVVGNFLTNVQGLPPQTQRALNGLFLGVKGIVSNDHSRDRESQSDQVGLYYMYQAGYDPREASSVWLKFMNETGNANTMAKISHTAKEWMVTSELYPYENPLQSIGDFMVGKMTEKLLDNWFSSHPKAKKRYRSLNTLVATNYAQEDFSASKINAEDYQEIKAMLVP